MDPEATYIINTTELMKIMFLNPSGRNYTEEEMLSYNRICKLVGDYARLIDINVSIIILKRKKELDELEQSDQ